VNGHITQDELLLEAAMSAGELIVVDALSSRAYDQRHLPSAVNLVAEHSDETVRASLPDISAAIAVYSTDADCGRGPDLLARLRALGYTKVRLYSGGIEDWVRSGLPIESTRP
jgi:rhodanese-related sulfurtransferase